MLQHRPERIHLMTPLLLFSRIFHSSFPIMQRPRGLAAEQGFVAPLRAIAYNITPLGIFKSFMLVFGMTRQSLGKKQGSIYYLQLIDKVK